MKLNLLEYSKLRSAYFSARIEGNDLTWEEIFEDYIKSKENSLIPRRQKILAIIKEHKIVNIDFIKRRFLKINERTLRNDIKKLLDGGFIQKLGTTRGVYYEIQHSL